MAYDIPSEDHKLVESDSDASFEFYCSDRDLCKNNPWVTADVSVSELKISQ